MNPPNNINDDGNIAGFIPLFPACDLYGVYRGKSGCGQTEFCFACSPKISIDVQQHHHNEGGDGGMAYGELSSEQEELHRYIMETLETQGYEQAVTALVTIYKESYQKNTTWVDADGVHHQSPPFLEHTARKHLQHHPTFKEATAHHLITETLLSTMRSFNDNMMTAQNTVHMDSMKGFIDAVRAYDRHNLQYKQYKKHNAHNKSL